MLQWGELTVVVTSASITSLLDTFNQRRILLKDVIFVDDLNIQFVVKTSDFNALRSVVNKRGDKLRRIQSQGSFYSIIRLFKRPVIILAFIFWLFLVLYLPSRILFLRVEGNRLVSDQEILSAAQQCGIQFGTSRRYVKSEKVKNALLSQISQLKWVGVNTKGCVATISVKEGAVPDKKTSEHNFGNIIANCDAVITDITVTAGNPLCKVGQAVRKGQVLVSGYTDCGLYIKTDEVNAEIYGITKRNISAMAMYPITFRGAATSVKSYYSIQLGKNIIKLNKYSGILDTACVKMYEKKVLALPGGFYLPVWLIKESVISHNDLQNAVVTDLEFDWVNEAVEKIFNGHMAAGEILQQSININQNESVCHYSGYYICREMIGKVSTKELLNNNGEGNR